MQDIDSKLFTKTVADKKEKGSESIGLAPFLAVRTRLELATSGVTGRHSNQTELPHLGC